MRTSNSTWELMDRPSIRVGPMPNKAARRLNLSSRESGTREASSIEKVDFTGDTIDCRCGVPVDDVDLLVGLDEDMIINCSKMGCWTYF